MSDQNLNTIVFIVYGVFLAIVLDIALILAWRRRNRNAKLRHNAEGRSLIAATDSPQGRRSVIAATDSPAGRRSAIAATNKSRKSAGTARPPAADSKGRRSPPEFPRGEKTAPLQSIRGQAIAATDSPVPADPPAERRSAKAAANKGASHVQLSVDLPEGESVRVTIESFSAGGQPVVIKTERVGGKSAAKPGAVSLTAPVAPAGSAGSAGGMRAALARFFGGVGRTLRTASVSLWGSAAASGRSLFFAALILYLATRLIGLTRWPIYFFTDEAVQTNFAATLAKNNLVWTNGETLPTFLENAGQYEMNFSVYLQIIPYLLVGKSEFVTRGMSVLVTLLGAAAVGLILKKAFRLPQWWSGVLLLSIIPAWFLDSRTAFESAEAVALYAVFLLFYLMYRTENVKWIFPALFFGALAAYTYSPAQLVVLVTGVLLLVTDIRYHLRFLRDHKWIALLTALFFAVLALPYIRFLVLHGQANRDQLEIVSSVWTRDIPVLDKFKLYFGEYLKGFDPRYWFLANPPEGVYHDIVRHLMLGYGHIMLWTLPFVVVGLLLCLANLRSPSYRALLIALLAAPSGAALAQITITRAMFVVVPAALFTALGIGWLLALFDRQADGLPEPLLAAREGARRLLARLATLPRSIAQRVGGVRYFLADWRDRARIALSGITGIARVPRALLSLVLFLSLATINVYMLWDALTNGPTWYTDYELYGMQYGGEQLSDALVVFQGAHPDAHLIVSTSWANGTDEIFNFFLPEGFPYRTGTVDEYMQSFLPLDPTDVFVATPDEFERAAASDRFADVTVLQILNDPNGQPGFYFLRLAYAPNIQEIITAEKEAEAKPVAEALTLLTGETVQITHSRFDMGSLADSFNADWGGLMRSQTANPMVLDILFPQSHRFTDVRVRVGGGPTRVTATFYPQGGGEPRVYSTEVGRSSDFRDLVIQLPAPLESSHLQLEVLTVGEGEPNHVHVYGVQLDGVGWTSRP